MLDREDDIRSLIGQSYEFDSTHQLHMSRPLTASIGGYRDKRPSHNHLEKNHPDREVSIAWLTVGTL